MFIIIARTYMYRYIVHTVDQYNTCRQTVTNPRDEITLSSQCIRRGWMNRVRIQIPGNKSSDRLFICTSIIRPMDTARRPISREAADTYYYGTTATAL